MTYGWAIIVILVVLAVLYLLGIFTPSGILGNQCNVQFRYSCTDLILATNGTVSFCWGRIRAATSITSQSLAQKAQMQLEGLILQVHGFTLMLKERLGALIILQAHSNSTAGQACRSTIRHAMPRQEQRLVYRRLAANLTAYYGRGIR